jgi:hypothetical protein
MVDAVTRRLAMLALPLALPLALCACTSYRVTGATRPTVDRASRIEAAQGPLNVALRATDGSPTFQYCRARLLEGPVLRVEGDTVIFRELTRLEPITESDPACRSTGAARLVYSAGTAQVSEERADVRRTVGVGLILGFAGLVFLGM